MRAAVTRRGLHMRLTIWGAFVCAVLSLSFPTRAWMIQPAESDPQFKEAREAGLALLKSLNAILEQFAQAEDKHMPIVLPKAEELARIQDRFQKIADNAKGSLKLENNPAAAVLVRAEANRFGFAVPGTSSEAYKLIAGEIGELIKAMENLQKSGWGPETAKDPRLRQLSNVVISRLSRTFQIANLVSFCLQVG